MSGCAETVMLGQLKTEVAAAQSDAKPNPAGKYHNITFFKDSEEATGSMQALTLVYGASAALPTSTFARKGFSFAGWSTASGGSVQKADQAEVTMGEQDISLFAVWTRHVHKVTFRDGGGTGTMADQTVSYGLGATLPVCAFQKKGYSFAGWAVVSGGQVVYTDAATYVPDDSDVTLWAVWAAGAIRVTFDKGDPAAEGSMPPQMMSANTTTALAINSYSRTGFRFDGWALTSGGAVAYANQAAYPVGDSDTILYAHWTRNTYVVTFQKDDAVATGTMDPLSLAYQDSVPLPTVGFSKTGYSFAGWATASGAGVTYFDRATFTMGAGSISLYAVWTRNSYSVTFQGNDPGGAGPQLYGSMGTQSLPFGVETPLAVNAYSKVGYSFAGWATTSAGPVVYNDAAPYTIGPGNVTLYAKWTPKPYQVTFDGNQATSGSMVPQTVIYGSPTLLSDVLFVRTGYTFAGWSTVPQGSAVYANRQSYSIGAANVTLYAAWSDNAQNITFHSNLVPDLITIQEANTGASVTLNANPFTGPAHYEFLGWATTPGSTVAAYSDQAVLTMPAGNLNLYGIWSLRATCTVTIYPYYPNVGGMPNDSPWVSGPLYVGETYQEPTTPPFAPPAGYYLYGWITGQNYRGTPQPFSSPHRPGTILLGTQNYLYGYWLNSYFTCYLDPNGGTGSRRIAGAGLKLGDSWTVPGNPTEFTAPTDKGFAGWSRSPDALVPDYYPGQTILDLNADVILYAVWGTLHTITYINAITPYVGYTASGSMSPQTNVPAGSKVTLSANGFSLVSNPAQRSGIYARGYFSWAGTGGPYDDKATIIMPDQELSLFAQF